MQYVIVTVDGRGTGFKGRKLRNPVKGNLGFFETLDQVNAARCVASSSFSFLHLVPVGPAGAGWTGVGWLGEFSRLFDVPPLGVAKVLSRQPIAIFELRELWVQPLANL